MRGIDLRDVDGRLRNDAAFMLTARAYFPNDDAAYLQALQLWHVEMGKLAIVGPDSFAPSEITSAVIRMAERRSAKMAVVGYVSIVMTFLQATGRRASLNAAAEIVSEFIFSSDGRVHWQEWMTPEGDVKSMAASGEPSNIKRYFREYRSVAHILAARCVLAEHVPFMPFWRRDMDAELRFIRTVAEFEARLFFVPNFASWNIWAVVPAMPMGVIDVQAFQPSDRFLTRLLGGSHRSTGIARLRTGVT